MHWVQVAAFQASEEAQAFAEEVQVLYAPVCVFPSSEGPTVRIGEFAIYMDAFLLWEEVRDQFSGVRVRYNSLEEEAAAGRHWTFEPLTAPPSSREIFRLSDRPLVSNEPLRFINEECALLEGSMRPLSRLPFEDEQETIIIEAENLVEFSTPEDTDAAEGSMMLADLLARRGDHQGARQAALPVADGTLLAPPQMRYDAMWLMARVYHGVNWRRTAHRAYKEIETVVTDPRDRARCLVEQAGLLLELAESGTGRMADNRLACSRIIQEFSETDDPEIRQMVATAAQMRAETFRMEGDHERSIAELEQVAGTYEDVARIHGMALYFLGFALHDNDQMEESLAVFERLARLNLTEADNFPTYDLSAMSYRNLVFLTIRQEEDERAEAYFREFAAEHPDSQWVRRSARRLRLSGYLSEEGRALVEQFLEEDGD